ncbi:MAG: hypothetical protein GEV00_02235 [Actinophytocola sp.]|nr:hypothetical protein [Actinophytocola sp.]
MTGYAADIAELVGLIGTLADSSQLIRVASGTLTTHGQLGHPVLADAAREFEESGRHDLRALATAAEDVVERLHDAARDYQGRDEAAAERFDGHIAAALGGTGA